MTDINSEQTKEDFVDVICSLTDSRIRYTVYFGTLLGFYRNGKFIPHDDDIDVLLIEPDHYLLENFLTSLKTQSFSIKRHEGDILTVQRGSVNIDFYIAKKSFNRYICNNYFFPLEYLDDVEEMEIFGIKVNIPVNTEECLTHLYGANWNVPISGYSASPKRVEYKIKLLVKRIVPRFIWRLLKFLFRRT